MRKLNLYDRKTLMKKLGHRLTFFITINFYIIVVVAMLNNGSVKVLFNHFNEAKVEYVMYGVMFPIILYSFISDVLEERKKRKERRLQNENNRESLPSN